MPSDTLYCVTITPVEPEERHVKVAFRTPALRDEYMARVPDADRALAKLKDVPLPGGTDGGVAHIVVRVHSPLTAARVKKSIANAFNSKADAETYVRETLSREDILGNDLKIELLNYAHYPNAVGKLASTTGEGGTSQKAWQWDALV